MNIFLKISYMIFKLKCLKSHQYKKKKQALRIKHSMHNFHRSFKQQTEYNYNTTVGLDLGYTRDSNGFSAGVLIKYLFVA